jgi:hypothetical protein
VVAFAFTIAVAGSVLVTKAFVASPRQTAQRSAPSSMATSGSVSPSPGPEVGANGLVIAYSATDVRFCEGATSDVLTEGPPNCSDQIQAVGVDVSALSDPHTGGGATWGEEHLVGHLKDGTLDVVEQGPPQQRPANGPSLVDPPCSPPPGGWAIDSAGEPSTDTVDSYQHQHPSEVVLVTMFRPQPQSWVVTIASTDPTRTTDALRPAYPDQLCVVQSRFRLAEVQDAKAAATSLLNQTQFNHAAYGVFEVGLGAGTDGQPLVEVGAIADTSLLRDALASEPAGLVQIEPWLEPVSG